MEQPPLGMISLLSITMIVASWIIYYVVSIAADGSLKTNKRSGIRFGPLLRSDQAWQDGHQAAKGPSRVTAWVVTALSCVSIPLGFTHPGFYYVALVSSLLALLIGSGFSIYKALESASATDPSNHSRSPG